MSDIAMVVLPAQYEEFMHLLDTILLSVGLRAAR